ncbi:endonuclease domain-containing protein [Streptomyces hilarionis]|uniref:endonuclease domain-containing protein n=1 Tax=Streptomyces hilarionis TaxID=2839954 RepID=UPI0027962DD2|nr:endonuclease domain-containing protein [Streptomyces hilarionis]MCQ9132839.1 endonuclease VII domain-containing protein [Streptomyces hilarionis]
MTLTSPWPAGQHLSTGSESAGVSKAASMTPLLVKRVLAAQRLVDRKYWGRCRGSGKYPCRNGTLDGVPACLRHLSPEERAVVDELLKEARRLVNRWLPHLVPACWFWPLPIGLDRSGNTEDLLFAWQQARCAICSHPGRRGRGTGSDLLVLDHDHRNGLARGFLCHKCNKREGLQRPGEDGRYGNYRSRPPAVLLGLSTPYSQAVRLRVPAPRHESTPAFEPGSPRALWKIRKLAPQLEEQLRLAAEDPKRRKYAGEEIWRILQTLVPVLLAAVERADRDVLHTELAELVRWLKQFPPSPAPQ